MSKEIAITDDQDVNELRAVLRELAGEHHLDDYDTTKIVTASSELARNILEYAMSGRVTVESPTPDSGCLRIIFEDDGPGIKDVDRAMEDGFSGDNSSGLGVGLPGAERLADEFEIESSRDEGTRVTIAIWTSTS